MPDHGGQDARLQAALAGVAGQIVGSGPPLVIEENPGVGNAVPGQLAKLLAVQGRSLPGPQHPGAIVAGSARAEGACRVAAQGLARLYPVGEVRRGSPCCWACYTARDGIS